MKRLRVGKVNIAGHGLRAADRYVGYARIARNSERVSIGNRLVLFILLSELDKAYFVKDNRIRVVTLVMLSPLK